MMEIVEWTGAALIATFVYLSPFKNGWRRLSAPIVGITGGVCFAAAASVADLWGVTFTNAALCAVHFWNLGKIIRERRDGSRGARLMPPTKSYGRCPSCRMLVRTRRANGLLWSHADMRRSNPVEKRFVRCSGGKQEPVEQSEISLEMHRSPVVISKQLEDRIFNG